MATLMGAYRLILTHFSGRQNIYPVADFVQKGSHHVFFLLSLLLCLTVFVATFLCHFVLFFSGCRILPGKANETV